MSISSRNITGADYSILASSLLLDEYHKDTLPDFFYEEGTVTSVFEDEQGIVLFIRGKVLNGAIVMDVQYLNNLNVKRNMRTMLEGLPIIEARAKANGFSGFIFESRVPLLRKFCTRRLGFQVHDENLLYKVIQRDKNEDLH